MHPFCARPAPLRKLLLCIATHECHVVRWLAPIQVASHRRVTIFNVETAQITHIPIVLYFNWVRAVRGTWTGGIAVSSPVRDIVRKGRAASTLWLGSAPAG